MPDIFNPTNHNKREVKDVGLVGKTKESKEPKTKSGITIPKGKKRRKVSGRSHNPLAAYSYYPDRVKFINEDPEEKVILLLRKHPVTNLRWLVISFFMIIAPAFFSVLSLFDIFPLRFQLVFIMIWYLLTMALIIEQFLIWFFHVNIVTDERIIEVDFVNLFFREITDANIDKIEDVTVEVSGALQTFMRFGNVIIQTAAEVPRINFESVPNPDKVSRILRELRIEEEVEKIEGRVR